MLLHTFSVNLSDINFILAVLLIAVMSETLTQCLCPSWEGLRTQLVANRCTNTIP